MVSCLEDYVPEEVKFLYSSILKIISLISKVTSNKIGSYEELKSEVTREALKLKIDEPIDIHFSLENDARSRRNNSGRLEVYLGAFLLGSLV